MSFNMSTHNFCVCLNRKTDHELLSIKIKLTFHRVAGTISEVKEGKWKIKLDNMKDKQDKW